MNFILRDYQTDCVNVVLEKFNTINSQLIQLPTGSGKTVILWNVLKELKKRSLIVAPTRELTEQLEDTGIEIVDSSNVYRKKRSYWPNSIKNIIMTCQSATFSMKGTKLDNFDPEIIVIDEAHRSRSKSLENLINHFKERGSLILGLTATPERLDGKSLLTVYDELTYTCSLVELIEKKYLVDLECFKIKTRHKLENIKYRFGDFDPTILKQLDVDSRNEIILDVYKNKCPGKKALVFCLNVAHSERMAQVFRDNNIRAASIHGGLCMTTRRTILKLFKDGDIQVLCNCQLLTEGFDEPSIEALILARPTKSKALYCQMIGRGVRPYPGKESCLIYDLTDEIHNICHFNALGSIPPESDFEFRDGEKFSEAIKRHELSIENIDYEYHRVNLYENKKKLPALKHQKELMDYFNIPFLADITIDEAAYLIFKTRLMQENGIDSADYWKKWRNNIPSTDTEKGITRDKC